MKCDELKEVMNVMQVSGEHIPSGYYKKSDVDAAIEELKAANKLLKEHIANGDVSRITWIDDCIDKDKEIAELKKKLMPCLNGDCILTCEVVEKYGIENADLKAKLEDVQASMYADVVDANMEVRRLKRALFIAHAIKARFKWWWMSECKHNESCKLSPDPRKIKKFTNSAWVCSKSQEKCRAKAEEYK